MIIFYFRVFSFFRYSIMSHGWQSNREHMLTSTSQLTFSFFVNLATVLECIPFSFKYCLFFPLISNAFHSLSKIILPFVPYGTLFILIHFLSICNYIYDNRFLLLCQCLFSCSKLYNKFMILSSIFVYIYILYFRLLSCII